MVSHGLMQIRRVREAQARVDGQRRPFDAAVRSRKHASSILGRKHPHVFLRDHRLGKADQLPGVALVHVDVAGLAAVNHDIDHLAAGILRLREDRRAYRIEIPYVVGDVLRVPLVGALVQIDRHHRIGIQVIARTNPAVEIGRRVADHEKYGARLLVDRRRHPYAAAELLIERAVLGERGLFGVDIAVHVAARCVLGIPDAFVALLGDRVERPQELAVLGVERLDEAADAVFAAVGADQYLAVDVRGRHRFRIALVGVGDLRFPHQLAGLRIQREQLRVDGAHVQRALGDRNAPVVVAAADGDDRPQLVFVVPVFLARFRVDGVNVIEGGRQEHDAVIDDGRGLHRLQHRRLEHERRLELAYVAGVDLLAGVVTGLLVAAVRVQPVLAVAAGAIEHCLRDVS